MLFDALKDRMKEWASEFKVAIVIPVVLFLIKVLLGSSKERELRQEALTVSDDLKEAAEDLEKKEDAVEDMEDTAADAAAEVDSMIEGGKPSADDGKLLEILPGLKERK